MKFKETIIKHKETIGYWLMFILPILFFYYAIVIYPRKDNDDKKIYDYLSDIEYYCSVRCDPDEDYQYENIQNTSLEDFLETTVFGEECVTECKSNSIMKLGITYEKWLKNKNIVYKILFPNSNDPLKKMLEKMHEDPTYLPPSKEMHRLLNE